MQNISKQVACHSAATSSGVNFTAKPSLPSEYSPNTLSLPPAPASFYVSPQATTRCRRSSALVNLATHITKRTKFNGTDPRDCGISSQTIPRRAILVYWTSRTAAGDPLICLSRVLLIHA